MFSAIALTLPAAWLLGSGVLHVGGNLIDAPPVSALIVVVWRPVTGRRAVL